MDYIVLDLEWNQSPDGKARTNPAIPFEIIEIGAVRLNEKKEETGRFHRMIRPQIYRRMNPMTKKVIHLDIKDLEKEETFPQVMEAFLSFCGEEYLFCTWGSMDLWELQRNMAFYHVANPFPRPLYFYDIQKLFSLLYEDGKSRRSLHDAADVLGLTASAPFHRALGDAWYTALILQKMNLDFVKDYVSVDYFRPPRDKKEEIYLVFPTYSKFVSRLYREREALLKDRNVTATKCYLCGKTLRKQIRWFPSGTKTYLSLACCPKHGYMKGKLRIKKDPEDQVFAVKTCKLIDGEKAGRLREKRLELTRRRREKRKKNHGGDLLENS